MVSSLGFTLSFEQGLTWFDLHFKTPTWVAMERTDWVGTAGEEAEG